MPGLNYGRKYCNSMAERPLRRDYEDQRKKVYIFDKNEDLIYQYNSLKDCSEKEGIKQNVLRNHIRSRHIVKDKYYSYSEILKPDTRLF